FPRRRRLASALVYGTEGYWFEPSGAHSKRRFLKRFVGTDDGGDDLLVAAALAHEGQPERRAAVGRRMVEELLVIALHQELAIFVAPQEDSGNLAPRSAPVQ